MIGCDECQTISNSTILYTLTYSVTRSIKKKTKKERRPIQKGHAHEFCLTFCCCCWFGSSHSDRDRGWKCFHLIVHPMVTKWTKMAHSRDTFFVLLRNIKNLLAHCLFQFKGCKTMNVIDNGQWMEKIIHTHTLQIKWNQCFDLEFNFIRIHCVTCYHLEWHNLFNVQNSALSDFSLFVTFSNFSMDKMILAGGEQSNAINFANRIFNKTFKHFQTYAHLQDRIEIERDVVCLSIFLSSAIRFTIVAHIYSHLEYQWEHVSHRKSSTAFHSTRAILFISGFRTLQKRIWASDLNEFLNWISIFDLFSICCNFFEKIKMDFLCSLPILIV